MSPLIVLVSIFVVTVIVRRLSGRETDYGWSGRLALSGMLIFTAIGHFRYTEGMKMMLPFELPFGTEIIVLTGLVEIGIAFGLVVPRTIKFSGWTLLIFLILALPSNIQAAINHVDFQNASFNGPGPEYLWFRIPVQLLFMVWTFLSTMDPCPFTVSMNSDEEGMLFI